MSEAIQDRNAGIELLRIICMIWIVAFHFSDHGAIDWVGNPLTLNWFLMAYSALGGGIGNGIYVLISGFFMWKKKFNIKRLFKIWFEVWLYGIIIGAICFATGIENFTWKTFFKILLPVIGNGYWFMTNYVVLMIFSPFINILINNLDKKGHLILVGTSLFFFSFLVTIPNIVWPQAVNNNILVFFMYYVIGAFIGKYKINGFEDNRKNIVVLMIAIIVMLVSELVLKIINFNVYFLIWGMEKITVVSVASIMLITFSRIKGLDNIGKIVNQIAGSVFGVYLIHIGLLNNLIFKNIFNNENQYYQSTYIIWFAAVVLLIFSICVLIDKLRIRLIEKPVMNLLDPVLETMDKKIACLFPA